MSSRSRRKSKERRLAAEGERKRALPGAPRSSGPSFGEELRRERELRGISLREVSESTKISLRYLEALERNQFESLPGGVFTKGFVKAYAQFIGLDPEGTVNAYLLERRSRAGDSPEDDDQDPQHLLRELARQPASSASRSAAGGRGPLWVAAAAVVVIVVSVAAVLLLRSPGDEEGSRDEPAAAARPAAEQTAPAIEPSPGQPAAEQPAAEGVAATEIADRETAAEETAVAPREAPAAGDAHPDEIRARVVLDRSTSGRLNCDNQRVEVLDGLPAGTVLDLRCRKYLVLDADDGGGVRVGIGGAPPAPLVADGVPLNGYRILPKPEGGGAGGASS